VDTHGHRVVLFSHPIMTSTTLQTEALSQRFLDGCEDAAFGQLPRYPDDDYLAGYLSTIKGLPLHPDGTIAHYSPHQHFAFGYMDSPDPCD
jgi:hypothetical protein